MHGTWCYRSQVLISDTRRAFYKTNTTGRREAKKKHFAWKCGELALNFSPFIRRRMKKKRKRKRKKLQQSNRGQSLDRGQKNETLSALLQLVLRSRQSTEDIAFSGEHSCGAPHAYCSGTPSGGCVVGRCWEPCSTWVPVPLFGLSSWLAG